MEDLTTRVAGWLAIVTEHPYIAAAVAVILVGFYVASTWKPKSTRDAESRLREIRDETHDYYRHLRPPGR